MSAALRLIVIQFCQLLQRTGEIRRGIKRVEDQLKKNFILNAQCMFTNLHYLFNVLFNKYLVTQNYFLLKFF